MRRSAPLDTPADSARLSSSSNVRLAVGAWAIQPVTMSSTVAIAAVSSSSSYAPSMSGYSSSGSVSDDDDAAAIRLRWQVPSYEHALTHTRHQQYGAL